MNVLFELVKFLNNKLINNQITVIFPDLYSRSSSFMSFRRCQTMEMPQCQCLVSVTCVCFLHFTECAWNKIDSHFRKSNLFDVILVSQSKNVINNMFSQVFISSLRTNTSKRSSKVPVWTEEQKLSILAGSCRQRMKHTVFSRSSFPLQNYLCKTEPVETTRFGNGSDSGSLSRVEVKFQHVLSTAVEAVFPRVSQRRSLEQLGFMADLAYQDRVHARCHGWSLVCWSGASVCCQQTTGSSPSPRHLPLHRWAALWSHTTPVNSEWRERDKVKGKYHFKKRVSLMKTG